MKSLILIAILAFNAYSAESQVSNKMFFVQSILHDGFICYGSATLEEYSKCVKETYDALTVNISNIYKGEFATKKDFVIYEIQVYELHLLDYTWKMIHYTDPKSSGWYRIYGFRENDFVHFYSRVLKHYLRKNQAIQTTLNTWEQNDQHFRNIDFACLLKAVSDKAPKADCMLSNTHLLHRDLLIISGNDQYVKNYKDYQLYSDVYARWSNRLYQGTFP